MKQGVWILIILGIFIALAVGLFVLIGNKEETVEDNFNSGQMVDCGQMENLTCFSDRFSDCLPVTVKLTATDGAPIDLTVLGYVNGTCHLQREVNDIENQNCYFPAGTNLTWDLVDQTFGNDRGLQGIVDSSCISA